MINKTAKGRLKNYDGVWYVLDSVWRLQTELDKKQYGDHLYDGMKVDYHVWVNPNNPNEHKAIIKDIIKERDDKINDILN